jgi:hypothetical protein
MPITRKYYPVWKAVSAADVGVPVQIRVHNTRVQTFKQAVCKEKTIETAIQKKLGMRFAGKLIFKLEPCPIKPDYSIVSISLEWDGRKL